MQCTPPPPCASTAPGTATTSRPGYSSAMIASIVGVGAGAGRRHEHRAVAARRGSRREPGATGSSPTPRVGQHRDLDHLDAGRLEPPAVVDARSRGSGSSASAQPWSSTRPGAVNATTLSTWPSVPSSSAIASASHTMRSTPSALAQRRLDLGSRSSAGLRFGLSRQRSVVTSRPAPSTAIDPPSSTIGTSRTGRPSCAAIAPPTAASASHGDHFSPHALNRKCSAWRNPSSATTTIGPVSRIHESSIGSATTSTPAPQHCAGRLGVGGRRDHRDRLVRARSRERSRRTPARAPARPASPHSPMSAIATVGHAMSVRSWRSVSAGMREPGSGTTRRKLAFAACR